MTNRTEALEAAARAFVAKLDECQPHIDAAFQHMHLRCGDYTGPQYGKELEELRAALRDTAGIAQQGVR